MAQPGWMYPVITCEIISLLHTFVIVNVVTDGRVNKGAVALIEMLYEENGLACICPNNNVCRNKCIHIPNKLFVVFGNCDDELII